MEINLPKSVELKIMKWCKLAKVVQAKKKKVYNEDLRYHYAYFSFHQLTSSSVKIPPFIFIAQVSTAFRWNANLLQLSFQVERETQSRNFCEFINDQGH